MAEKEEIDKDSSEYNGGGKINNNNRKQNKQRGKGETMVKEV